MQSLNFEFIRPHRPELADLGGMAEYHLYVDPGSSLVKLRTLAEQVVKTIHQLERLPKLHRPQLIDLINDAAFQEVASKPLITNLNYLRIQGNGPAHGEPGDLRTAMIALGVAQQVTAYLAMRYYTVDRSLIPAFREPPDVSKQTAVLQRDSQHYKKIAQQKTEELERLLEEIEQLRAGAKIQEATAEERQASAVSSRQVSDALAWSEAKTRALMIDALLARAGWDISNKNQVTLEWEVQHQPTASGLGKGGFALSIHRQTEPCNSHVLQ